MILFLTSLTAEQEKQNQRKSFLGNPMSILDLYQHSLYGHFGENGPEQLTHYSLIEQLSGASSKDSKGKDSLSVSYCDFYITSRFLHGYFRLPLVFSSVCWLITKTRQTWKKRHDLQKSKDLNIVRTACYILMLTCHRIRLPKLTSRDRLALALCHLRGAGI